MDQNLQFVCKLHQCLNSLPIDFVHSLTSACATAPYSTTASKSYPIELFSRYNLITFSESIISRNLTGSRVRLSRHSGSRNISRAGLCRLPPFLTPRRANCKLLLPPDSKTYGSSRSSLFRRTHHCDQGCSSCLSFEFGSSLSAVSSRNHHIYIT